MIEVAAFACVGVGLIISISSRRDKLIAEKLNEATLINELKGLGKFLANEPLNRTVVVYGTVGSTSTVENNRSGGLGVYVEENVTICFKRKDGDHDSEQEYRKVMLNRKQVPWYLDDGTTRVNVMEIQFAKGFYATLKKYFFTEPVAEHFERFFSMKDVQIYAPDCCDHVLEIGTPLTVVGRAEKDEDGAPMIGRAYEVFNGHIIVDKLVSDLKSNSLIYADFSWFLTAIGVALVLQCTHYKFV
ncbi:hypothetical protein AALP_AAs74122U000100 [Arabis alpina]|uniref:RING-type E3 ubiquitin transferase n=1 Tax=Arabis alpina TaxID=50452 RepID=A0A087FXI9_ARAAL|nr:hypothetical protein AALP_AAs74122U000100 [Arabis alpina]